MLAARLLVVSAVLLLAPGLLLLAVAARADANGPSESCSRFALSYCWIFALSIAVPVLEWNVDAAALLTVLLLWRSASRRFGVGCDGAPAPSLDRRDLLLVVALPASPPRRHGSSSRRSPAKKSSTSRRSAALRTAARFPSRTRRCSRMRGRSTCSSRISSRSASSRGGRAPIRSSPSSSSARSSCRWR